VQICGIGFSFFTRDNGSFVAVFYKLFAFYFPVHSTFYFFMAVFSFLVIECLPGFLPEKNFMLFFLLLILPVIACSAYPAVHWL
jgi:hypothetical protein